MDAAGYVGVTAVVRDVTAHRRAEQALEESERRFRAVIEQASDGIGIMDPEGNMLAVNRRGCEMFGFSEDEVLRLNFLDTISASPVTLLRSVEWSQAALRSAAPITVEVQGRRKDGSRFPVEVRLGRLELSERTLLLFIARDVSERRSLERDVLYAAVRERERIGRELHDGIGQQLTGLSFLIEALHRQMRKHSVEGADIASDIASGLREALDSVYSIIRGVMPLGLQAVDLPVALQSLAGRIEERFGRPCFFTGQLCVDISQEAMEQLYYIAQEAATNAAKHARPQRILIALTGTEFPITLSIQDDGDGIPQDAENHGGAGLRIMRYRANLIGAELRIERLADRGSLVRCTLANGLLGTPLPG